MVHHGNNGPGGTGNWPYYHKEIWFRWKTFLDSSFPDQTNGHVGSHRPMAQRQWGSATPGTECHQRPVSARHVQRHDPLVRACAQEQWIDFRAHIKFNSVASLGLVEFAVDGVQVASAQVALEQCCFPLSVTPYPVYFHMGIYRDPATVGTGILYDAPIHIGDSAAWVDG